MANETAKGWHTKAGVKYQDAYGTPVAVGTGNQFRFNDEQIQTVIEQHPDPGIDGRPGYGKPISGLTRISGRMSAYLKYWDAIHALLKGAFGSTSMPQHMGLYAYADNFELDDTLEGMFFTMIFDKQVKIWEYEGVKVDGVEISCAAGGRARISFDLIGHSLNRDSVVNTQVEVNQLTYLDAPNPSGYLVFDHLACLINETDEAALGSGDVVPIRSFSLSIRNGLGRDIYESGNNSLITQPRRESKRSVVLRIELGRYRADGSDDVWLEAYQNSTLLKAKLYFVGPLIGGAFYNQFNLYFPNLTIIEAPRPVTGPGLVPAALTMIATAPDGFTAGMEQDDELLSTDIMEEVRITLMNRQAADLV